MLYWIKQKIANYYFRKVMIKNKELGDTFGFTNSRLNNTRIVDRMSVTSSRELVKKIDDILDDVIIASKYID